MLGAVEIVNIDHRAKNGARPFLLRRNFAEGVEVEFATHSEAITCAESCNLDQRHFAR